jgi:hypothetical protein
MTTLDDAENTPDSLNGDREREKDSKDKNNSLRQCQHD